MLGQPLEILRLASAGALDEDVLQHAKRNSYGRYRATTLPRGQLSFIKLFN
jgi:hypothetical protein